MLIMLRNHLQPDQISALLLDDVVWAVELERESCAWLCRSRGHADLADAILAKDKE